jgi:hypothetical protein
MPTGASKLNPAGLSASARALQKILFETQNLSALLARSKDFTARFDKAVMRKDKKLIMRLLKEGGISAGKGRKVTVDKINPDRRINIYIKTKRFVITITLEW